MTDGYQSLRNGAAWMDLSARGRIEARGRDRARLLHNITTNEIKKMPPGAGCYAFLLSPQGRIQADLLLFCFEDKFLIDSEPELRETVQRHIRKYIVADQVELMDVSGETAEIALEGPGSAVVLASLNITIPGEEYSHVPWEGGFVARVSSTGQPGFRLFCPSGEAESVIRRLESAGARPAADEDARVVRIENGLPRYGQDIRDTSLPQETGQMHAVSFTKGCYLGQEIVERIRARGHVNRTLRRIELDGNDPAVPGAALTVDGKQAEVTSSVYSPKFGRAIALAYVRE